MLSFIPSLVSLRALAITGGIAFLAGSWAGGQLVWWLWDVANTRSELAEHRKNQARVAEVLKVNDHVNAEDDRAEKLNEEIYNAIVTKFKTAPKPSNPACDPDPVCISVDGMRGIQRLQ